MSRDLRDELAETLRERATSVPDVPTLAGASLARGRALRRRRRIATTLAPAFVAVVLVTAATALTGAYERAEGPSGGPTATSELPAPRPPYAVGEGRGTDARTLIVVGDRSVPLPEGTSVGLLHRAGTGVVVEVIGSDTQGVAFVDGEGRLRMLPDLGLPVAVAPDGRTVAALSDAGEGGPRMVLARLPDGKPLATLPGDRAPLAFVTGEETGQDTGPGPVVLFAAGDRLGTWDVTEQTAREVPRVRRGEDDILSAARDGRRVAIVGEREFRVVDLQGRTLWTRPDRYGRNWSFSWTPDGTGIVLSVGGRIVVVSAATGRTLVESPKQPFDLFALMWLDDRHFLGQESDLVTDEVRERRFACDVVTGTCETYGARFAILAEP
jgi:hypothetical protein